MNNCFTQTTIDRIMSIGIFATMEAYYAYLKKGGRVKVLHSSKLLAVCVNPLAPNGYRLDSDELREAIQTSLGVPAYDVRKMDFN